MKKYFNFDLFKIIFSLFFLLLSFCFSNSIVLGVCYFLSYVMISYEMYLEMFQHFRKRDFFNEEFLMIIATLGAFFIGSYLEGVMVILLYQIGEYLSDLAVFKSKKSIMDLLSLKVSEVRLENGEVISSSDIHVGDRFLVRVGEVIPVDGKVVSGSSFVDTKSLTGEALPRKVEPDSVVLSGFINSHSVLVVEATCDYQNSTSQKILDMIENSCDKKSRYEDFMTKFSRIYTPCVVFISFFIVFIPTLLGYDFHEWLYKGLVFIVTSCPCALVISVPLGYFCGIGKASLNGILVKGAKELELLSRVDTIVLDKTGTLTEGVMKIKKISTSMDEDKFLQIVASAEEGSLHPIASVLSLSNKKLLKVTQYEEFPGMGISCLVKGQEVLVGNEKLLSSFGIEFSKENGVDTIIYVAIDKKYVGFIELGDEIKKESYSLKDLGRRLVILSGDNSNMVSQVAKKLGISSYYGDLLPMDKVALVKDYKKDGFVLFVGDGINDAPVLMEADIGVSLGKIGSDVSLDASEIVLMDDDLSKLKMAIDISTLTNRRVRESVFFAFFVKIVVLVLGVLGYSSILMAVFADVGVTLLVIIYVLSIFLYQ